MHLHFKHKFKNKFRFKPKTKYQKTPKIMKSRRLTKISRAANALPNSTTKKILIVYLAACVSSRKSQTFSANGKQHFSTDASSHNIGFLSELSREVVEHKSRSRPERFKILKKLKSLEHRIALPWMKRMHLATCCDKEQKLEVINLIKCYNAASPPRIYFIHKDTNLEHVQVVRTCAFNLHFALPSLLTGITIFWQTAAIRFVE